MIVSASSRRSSMFLSPPAVSRRTGSWRKEDRRPPTARSGKGPVVGRGAVVGVDDEPLNADRPAVVHRKGDERAAADGQQRLGAVLRQRVEACSQPRPENEGRSNLWIVHHSFLPNAGSILINAATTKPGASRRGSRGRNRNIQAAPGSSRSTSPGSSFRGP